MELAIFDFDNTVSERDSLLPFLKSSIDILGLIQGLIICFPWLLGYSLGFISNERAKEKLLWCYFRQWNWDKFVHKSEMFSSRRLPKLIRKEALERLHWHCKEGHTTVLVSASLETYLSPWAESVGFDCIIGTQMEVLDYRLTGYLKGKNCYGQEKVRRLQELFGDLSRYTIYAYGDSRGDKELLVLADYPYYRTFQNPPTPYPGSILSEKYECQ